MNEGKSSGPAARPARQYLDFEKPIYELEVKIAELKQLASIQNISVDDEIQKLTGKASRLRTEIFTKRLLTLTSDNAVPRSLSGSTRSDDSTQATSLAAQSTQLLVVAP